MTRLGQLRPLLLRTPRGRCPGQSRFASSVGNEPPNDDCNSSSSGSSSSSSSSSKVNNRPMYIPEAPRSIEELAEPTTCCMSGCANCVWIEYAEKLSGALKGSPGDVQERIMDRVQDPNMRAFLSMELRVRKLID